MKLDQNYWRSRYRNNETGWDLKQISPPLKNYIDQLKDKSVKILIPGGGNSYEAEYLFSNGFENVFVVDIAAEPLKNLKLRMPAFPEKNLLNRDFFSLVEGGFDLILEQTFFCTLPVSKRKNYVEKMKSLLKEDGKLVGLLFDITFSNGEPPFGGSKEGYLSLFAAEFNIEILEPCYNSVLPRQGNELFFIFKN